MDVQLISVDDTNKEDYKVALKVDDKEIYIMVPKTGTYFGRAIKDNFTYWLNLVSDSHYT